MTGSVLDFLHGALALGCVAIGIKFLKFWRISSDRFFIWFAAAFWIFGVGWVARAFVSISEHAYLVFVPRLVAFLMILVAILDKNRQKEP